MRVMATYVHNHFGLLAAAIPQPKARQRSLTVLGRDC